ncbi:MAG: zinc-binding protein [archaeon]|nr:zinc-binding protein [archaeon]
MVKEIALAACSGMSPNGLVARVSVSDLAIDDKHALSICMGSVSADDEGFKSIANEFPVFAVNGCEGNCVGKILRDKGIDVIGEINVGDTLEPTGHRANDVARLDDEGELCVSILKEAIEEKLSELRD